MYGRDGSFGDFYSSFTTGLSWRVYVVNAPASFTVVWRVLAPFLYEEFARKVVILGELDDARGSANAALRRHAAADGVPLAALPASICADCGHPGVALDVAAPLIAADAAAWDTRA